MKSFSRIVSLLGIYMSFLASSAFILERFGSIPSNYWYPCFTSIFFLTLSLSYYFRYRWGREYSSLVVSGNRAIFSTIFVWVCLVTMPLLFILYTAGFLCFGLVFAGFLLARLTIYYVVREWSLVDISLRVRSFSRGGMEDERV